MQLDIGEILFAIYANSHDRFAQNFELNLRIAICAKVRMRFVKCDLQFTRIVT